MKIDISKVTPDKRVPTDKKFRELYKKILLGQLGYYYAIIDVRGIKPFTDYKPDPSTAFRHKMLKRLQNRDYPKIHLYQEGEVFIMSDDHHAYYTYLELGITEIPSLVMGEPTGRWVISKDKIPNPKELTAELLEEPMKN